MISQSEQQNISKNEISLKDLILKSREFFSYLFSKWKFILFAFIIGGGIGLIYSINKKTKYTASLTFVLEDKNQSSPLGAYAGLAGQFGIDLGNSSEGVFSEGNIMQLMKSRLIVSKTLLSGILVKGRAISLADYYMQFKHLHTKLLKRGGISGNISFKINSNLDSLTDIQDSLMGLFYNQILKNNLTINKPNKELSIISVNCKSQNEQFAKDFVETLVEKVSSFYIQTRTKKASQNLDIVQNRLDSVRAAYNDALYGTAKSFDQNLDPSRAITNVPRLRNQTITQILGTEYAELVKSLEISKLTLLQETPLIQVIDRPIYPLPKVKLSIGKAVIAGGLIMGFILLFVFSLKFIYTEIMK